MVPAAGGNVTASVPRTVVVTFTLAAVAAQSRTTT